MSIKKDFEEADKQFNDYLYPNGKGKSPVKKYDIEPFGDKEWGMFKSDIWAKVQIGSMLINKFKTHYDDGWYPSKEEFIVTVNRLYENLQNCHDALKSQSPTDNEIFDDLFEEYNNVNNQRTYNFSVADKLLRSEAFKIQSRIEKYLEKKVKAGEPLTTVMIGFEDVDTLETKNKFNPIPQDAYIPPTEEEIKKHTQQYHEPVGEVDRTSYSNHTLYILAEDMDGDWEKNKDTEEFSCYDGDRINFFGWCAKKYRYKGGKTFTAKGMENSLTTSRTRAKSNKEEDYK